MQMLPAAASTEPYRTDTCCCDAFADYHLDNDAHLVGLISRNIQQTVAHLARNAEWYINKADKAAAAAVGHSGRGFTVVLPVERGEK